MRENTLADIFNVSDVFISYSRKDKAFVEKLDKAFKAQNLEVWIDWEDIPLSVNWWEEIKAGIEGANTFVFVVSPDSVQSEVCRDEIDHALQNNKRFIPIVYRDIKAEAHGDKLHAAITSHNWLFFRDEDDFEVAFHHLLETMQADFDYIRLHTRLLVRAREWEAQGETRGYLLRGAELAEAERWLASSSGKEPEPSELQNRYIYASLQAQRRQRETLLAGVSVALMITIALAGLSFIAFQNAERNLQIANARGTQVAEQRAIAVENEAVARSISLAVNAQVEFENGDTYRALPFALSAIEVKPMGLAQQTLGKVAYNPGARKWLVDHLEAVTEIDSHPTRNEAVSSSRDGTLIVWDMNSGEVLHQLTGHDAPVHDVAYSPDGSKVVSIAGSEESEIMLWDADNGGLLQTWQAPLPPTGDSETGATAEFNSDIAFSPDGSMIAHSNRSGIVVSEATSGRTLQTINVTQTVHSLIFAPDGDSIIAGLDNGKIMFWAVEAAANAERPANASSGNRPSAPTAPDRILEGPGAHQKGVFALAISPDGSQLLSGGVDKTLIVWELAGGTIIRHLRDHTGIIEAVAFLPDGDHAFSAADDRNLIYWDLELGRPERILTGHVGLPEAVAVSADGRIALSGSRNGILILWDLLVDELSRDFGEMRGGVQAVAIHPDGKLAAAAAENRTLSLWDLNRTEELRQVEDAHGGLIFDVAFAQEGTLLVTAADDGVVHLWDTDSLERIGTLRAHDEAVFDLDVSPNGQRLLTASQDSTVILWDLEAQAIIRSFDDLSTRRMLSVKFHPDGQSAFASSNVDLFRFDLQTGAIVQEYPGHTDSIVGLDVTRDGQTLAASDVNRQIILWDVEQGTREQLLLGQNAAVWSVAFDSTGERLLSGADDGSLNLWDLNSGEVIREFTDHRGVIRSVAFTPDDRYAFYGEEELHLIRLLDLDALLAWVHENRLVRNLSCLEQTELLLEPLCNPDIEAQTASVGENQGEIYLDATQTWLYEGRAGEILNIRVTAGHPATGVNGQTRQRILGLLDLVIEVNNPADEPIAENDDDPENTTTDSAIYQLQLPEDGRYEIVVGSYKGLTSGPYTLFIEQAGNVE